MLQKSASTPAFADPNQPPLLQYQEAQIEWYGQKASISYIEVNQLAHFAQDYQKKYKPKLRTASYQDAVKLATQALTRAPGDASLVEEDEEEQDVLSEIISESRERQKTLNNQIIQNDVYHFPPLEDTRRPTSAS
jgi:ABC-type branched-subunit amino acid transport system substrate-binding protein